jgi:hypothetical protein
MRVYLCILVFIILMNYIFKLVVTLVHRIHVIFDNLEGNNLKLT